MKIYLAGAATGGSWRKEDRIKYISVNKTGGAE